LISERTATRTLKEWDRITARIVVQGQKCILAGGLLAFTFEGSERLMANLQEAAVQTLGSGRSARGVLAVSWGADGAIRLWDRQGKPDWVDGMLALGDELVSWGASGVIRFWDQQGNPLPGGTPDAHSGGVSGVLAVRDKLVSWGGDGAIRFWDRHGNPLPGGVPDAHSSPGGSRECLRSATGW
jgi:hypothetical protein